MSARSAEAVARAVADGCAHETWEPTACRACIAAALTAHATAAVAGERERTRTLVQTWADAYALDIFHPLAEGEAARVNATFPGFSDRCGAHLGRHMAKRLLEDMAAAPQDEMRAAYDRVEGRDG